MGNKKYTVVLVPDEGEETRRFSISRRTLRFGFLTVFLLLIGNIVFGVFFFPKVIDYNRIQKQNIVMMEERVKVAKLIKDLKRIQQMESYIRQHLGGDLEFPLNPVFPDSVAESPHPVKMDNTYISYIENIPSFAPINGFITQDFCEDEFTSSDNHYGVDIAASSGTAVKAAASGLVVFSDWTYRYGNLVILFHGDDYFSLYGHNQRNLVSERQYVDRGDDIALLGETGIATGPHLHFEIWKNGKPVDPKLFVSEFRLSNLLTRTDD